MIWFTSDTHFFHNNVIKFDNRPFKSMDQMIFMMIRKWNSCVSKKDVVYHLGDFGFGNPKNMIPIVNQLNGNITLIRGNHDYQSRYTHERCAGMFKDICDIKHIELKGEHVTLTHLPFVDSRLNHLTPKNIGQWHIYGHVHSTRPKIVDKEINVCCCLWDYKPVSEKVIVQIMRDYEKKWKFEVVL